MTKTGAGSFVALALLAALPSVAQAQAQTPRTACRADVRKLCADTSPGGGRLITCLKEQADKLSPDCKEALKSAKGN